jgi:hypothetical protein
VDPYSISPPDSGLTRNLAVKFRDCLP